MTEKLEIEAGRCHVNSSAGVCPFFTAPCDEVPRYCDHHAVSAALDHDRFGTIRDTACPFGAGPIRVTLEAKP